MVVSPAGYAYMTEQLCTLAQASQQVACDTLLLTYYL